MKFKCLNIALTSLILSAICLSNYVNANLIVNGDFSAGGSDWSFSSACVGQNYMVSYGGGGILLNQCGEDDVDPSISQTVSGLSVGVGYELFWDRKYHSSIQNNSFGVFLDNTVLEIFNHISTSGYLTESVMFIANNNIHTIKFAAELDQRTAGVSSRTDTSYYIDNISLAASEVPEPSTLAIFGLGLMGFASRRLKKKP